MRSFINNVLPYFPAFLSGLLCFVLIYLLNVYIDPAAITQSRLDSVLSLIILMSVFLIVLIIVFVFFKASQIQVVGSALSEEITKLTQKVHHFRDIIDVLVRSKVWAPGLKEYIDEEFGDLNFFQMKEFYKGKSKIAVEYIQENNRYGETEALYLEAKSLLLTDPNGSKIDSYSNPRRYDKRLLQKWIQHKCGSGLWYFFGYKYASFKDELDVNRIFERHQDKIVDLAVSLDAQRYQDAGFSEELLSKIGEQMSEEVFPRLYVLTSQTQRSLPGIVSSTYVLAILILFTGVFLPLSTLLFNLDRFFGNTSIAIVISILTYLVLATYPYLKRELNKQR